MGQIVKIIAQLRKFFSFFLEMIEIRKFIYNFDVD